MLVLTRKMGEKVIIGTDIEVIVLDVRGDKVKLGFVAPRQVPIQREEILGKPAGGADQQVQARSSMSACA